MDEKSLANIGEGLTRPATVLIEKVSDAVGGIFEPYQIRRVAQAEADTRLIHAKRDIEITDLQRRAALRWVEEQAQHQFNMEGITPKALPLVTEDASPQEMDNDWITNFFDKCRGVSDDQMQHLWARILAGEANRIGSFSRKAVNIVEDLDSKDVSIFSTLCRFTWLFENLISPVVFDLKDEIYRNNGVAYTALLQLESLGLIHFNNLSPMRLQHLEQTVVFEYFSRPLELRLSEVSDNNFTISHVIFTQAGGELFRACGPVGLPGFYEYISDKWEAESNVVSMKRFP